MAEFDSNYYEEKYLKYKKKYLELVGGRIGDTIWQVETEELDVWNDIDMRDKLKKLLQSKLELKLNKEMQERLLKYKKDPGYAKGLGEITSTEERELKKKLEHDTTVEQEIEILLKSPLSYIKKLCEECKKYRRIKIIEKDDVNSEFTWQMCSDPGNKKWTDLKSDKNPKTLNLILEKSKNISSPLYYYTNSIYNNGLANMGLTDRITDGKFRKFVFIDYK